VYLFLLSLRLLRLLVLLKKVLAEIHNPTDRWLSIRRNLDEIKAFVFSQLDGVVQWHNSGLLAARVNDPNLLGIYFFVTPYALVDCDP
jgi:hypothetical protein